MMSILETTISLILQWWWIPAPIVLFLAFSSLWLYLKRVEYIKKINWVQLRLVVPQEVLKTPLAMEQVFANLHSIQLEGTWFERNIKGRVQEWYSCELVSLGGDIYFFLRTPAQFRNLVESAIYAQYPDAEITESEDYVFNVPDDLPNEDLELFGSEFKLISDNPYPIRTYEHFKFETEEGAGDVDPIAHIMESLGRLRAGEQIWLQMVIRPVDSSWKDEGEGIIEELLGRKEKKSKGKGIGTMLVDELGEYVSAIPQAPFGPPIYGTATPEEKKQSQQKIPAIHESDRIKEIARKLSKVAFKTIIRGVYIAPKEIFDVPTYFSVVGGFKQFTSQDLNGLRPAAITGGKWPFKASKTRVAKKQHLLKFRLRRAPSEEDGFILNTEELATIFHFPGRIVTTPTLPRVESRKGEPPSGLPVL